MSQSIRLVHSDDSVPGITRVRRGSTFAYVTPRGTRLREGAVLQRIRALAIPPAWTHVWISPRADGHVQATGRDARGRKQHRYHAAWVAARKRDKFSHVLEFAALLPALRRQVAADLRARGLPRRKVLALVVTLLERTLIRVGNDEYARTNGSFGLATMHDSHARIAGASVRFIFRGKSGKAHDISITDRRVARAVRQCRELPGRQLFQYVDGRGVVRDIGSGDVNAYLQAAMGRSFTAKDFRTWAGTVLACRALSGRPQPSSAASGTREIATAIGAVADVLGNTKAVCRSSYIHPAVLEGYSSGALGRAFPSGLTGASRARRFERAVMRFLRRKRRLTAV